jgi:ketosteroid isomerase-like protein
VDELEEAERSLWEALRSGDLDDAARRLHDDFLITTAGWLAEPVGKHAWLDGFRARMTLTDFDFTLIATRRYGDAAVVVCESTQTGTHDGAPFTMTFRYTDVWVPEGGEWVLAVRHASALPSR